MENPMPSAAQRLVTPQTGVITSPWLQWISQLPTTIPTSGVTSFNTRTGAVTLASADVTGALTFTPYNATNPSGYVAVTTSGQTTPTPSASSGAFTTVSSVVDYEQIGRFMKVRITITITANGTAAGVISLTIPATATSESSFWGRCNAVSGKAVAGVVAAASNQLKIVAYDNTYPGSTGERISLEGMIFV